EPDLPQLEERRRGERLAELPRAHPAGPHVLADEVRRREARDQRTVEVEEGCDPRPGWTGVDLAREVGVQRHGGRLFTTKRGVRTASEAARGGANARPRTRAATPSAGASATAVPSRSRRRGRRARVPPGGTRRP